MKEDYMELKQKCYSLGHLWIRTIIMDFCLQLQKQLGFFHNSLADKRKFYVFLSFVKFLD